MKLTTFPTFTKPLQTVTPQFSASETLTRPALNETEKDVYDCVPGTEAEALTQAEIYESIPTDNMGHPMAPSKVQNALMQLLNQGYVKASSIKTDKTPENPNGVILKYYRAPNPQ